MRKDPRQGKVQLSALEYFTNRERAIETFTRYLNASEGEPIRVLNFYGVGGIGKTTLLRKLHHIAETEYPKLPRALFNLDSLHDRIHPYREVLLSWRVELERQHGIKFPHFDICLAVMLARAGGTLPDLIQNHSLLNEAVLFALELFQVPYEGLSRLLQGVARRFRKLEEGILRLTGQNDLIDLRRRALLDDPELSEELIRRFVLDLAERAPKREGKACKAVLMLDTYEALWQGREPGDSAQARLVDGWVRILASYCLGSDILLVIAGRDRLKWAEHDPDDWREELDTHLLGGLSASDAQAFLARCGIGEPPPTPPDPLQKAIVECCDEDPDPIRVQVHPLYLALCAEIVLNTRQQEGQDPPPALFRGIPTQQVASQLADRFLKSLHNRAMELWLEELSLTPRFDETCALALDTARQHHNGRGGWEVLLHFSFIEPLPDGFYRLHKVMRDVLIARMRVERVQAVRQWFLSHWQARGIGSLAFYQLWQMEPRAALEVWIETHKNLLKSQRIAEAREMLGWWDDVEWDERERQRLGDALWAEANFRLGIAFSETPTAERARTLESALSHCLLALQVYNRDTNPEDWARTNMLLGFVLGELSKVDESLETESNITTDNEWVYVDESLLAQIATVFLENSLQFLTKKHIQKHGR